LLVAAPIGLAVYVTAGLYLGIDGIDDAWTAVRRRVARLRS
jgi:hypothetical protein